MCEFCISHGEGRKWYENMTNYSRELFLQVSSDEGLKNFLANFGRSMWENIPRAEKWKRRLPFIYDFLVYPWLTRGQKKSHFGQMVPVEDVEKILRQVGTVWRLPCICRKVATGEEKRYCYAVGMDATGIMRELPDFRNFDRTTPETAMNEIRDLDANGMTHSVWTFQTPFIGAVCNCDHDCMAYRVEYRSQLARVMWKAEYVATIDRDLCKGCRMCRKQCMFESVDYSREQQKCSINYLKCYGCGVCRAVCPEGAVSLVPREEKQPAAGSW
jgi:Pyruvate/2-oxoacid:ferredoxin oxidoreductase delta subunit